MKSAITVVITGCNRARRGIVQSLKNNRDGRDVRVIGINYSPYNILRTDVDEFVVAPSITDPEYIPWLRDLCKDKKVDVLIPFIQGELPIASKYAESLLEVGTHVSITDPKSLNLLNDKIALAERYPEYFPAQKVVNSSDGVREFAEKVGYYDGDHPMCCKIAGKCGGLGFAILDEQKWMDVTFFNRAGSNRFISIGQLCEIMDHDGTEVILQEYIRGTEYCTVVLADHGEVAGICGFMGYAMEFGCYTSGAMLKNQMAYNMTERVVRETGLDGNACFDFILKEDGTPIMLECNPRISAGIAFPDRAGADFVYQRCLQLIGEPFLREYDIDYDLKMVRNDDFYYYK